MPMLRVHGAIPPFLHVFMAWYFVKYSTKITDRILMNCFKTTAYFFNNPTGGHNFNSTKTLDQIKHGVHLMYCHWQHKWNSRVRTVSEHCVAFI
jgi:hypothetical protein